MFLFTVWLCVCCAHKSRCNHYEGERGTALGYFGLFFFAPSYDAKVLLITCANRSSVNPSSLVPLHFSLCCQVLAHPGNGDVIVQRCHCENPPLVLRIPSAALQHSMAVLSFVAQRLFSPRGLLFLFSAETV